MTLEEYIEQHSTPENEVLQTITRSTYNHVLNPHMLSGHVQGRVLSMLSHMIRPHRVLELGTFTGYSTICLAEGLSKDGLIYTIEKDEEREPLIRKYLHLAGIESKTHLLFGRALDIIPRLQETWDLIFIDADKVNYLNYYKLLINHLSEDGILLADNVLWSGKVVKEVKHNDKDTLALLEFNQYVQADATVKNMILPFRDGMMLVEKKK